MRGSGDSEGLLHDEYELQEQDDACEVIGNIYGQCQRSPSLSINLILQTGSANNPGPMAMLECLANLGVDSTACKWHLGNQRH